VRGGSVTVGQSGKDWEDCQKVEKNWFCDPYRWSKWTKRMSAIPSRYFQRRGKFHIVKVPERIALIYVFYYQRQKKSEGDTWRLQGECGNVAILYLA